MVRRAGIPRARQIVGRPVAGVLAAPVARRHRLGLPDAVGERVVVSVCSGVGKTEIMPAGLRATYLESRPRTTRTNLPKPKPPSLGWPRSFTPQDFMTSIQLRTSSSSLRETKSKKLRPMHVVVEIRLSFEQ